MLDNFQYPISGGRGPSPMGIGSSQREIDQQEIRLQVQGRSGPDYTIIVSMFPSHLQKVCSLGANDPTVVASRQRLGNNLAGQGCDWTEVKMKIQELYDRGKLKKWCGSPEAAQGEIDKVWKYFNAAVLGGNL